MSLHIISLNNEQLTLVLQSLNATQNAPAKELSIRLKNMATPAIDEENEHAHNAT